MKKLLLSTLIITASTLPFTVNAQNMETGSFYAVAEAGLTKTSMTHSGFYDAETVTLDNNVGAAFGGSMGYRFFSGPSLIFGLEGTMSTSGGSSSITSVSADPDITSTTSFNTNYNWGGYFTLGGRFGTKKDIFVYGLIGIGGTQIDNKTEVVTEDSTTILLGESDSGNGFSIGAAIETGIGNNLGVRVKMLHNLYEAGTAESRVRDTSFMAGLVLNF